MHHTQCTLHWLTPRAGGVANALVPPSTIPASGHPLSLRHTHGCCRLSTTFHDKTWEAQFSHSKMVLRG